jgi:hypothetical protein
MATHGDDQRLLAGSEVPFAFVEEPPSNDRKRYTAQLQRRAQAHITAELGGASVVPDVDRQVTMVVQHALEATGARRVSLFRPVVRGRRWHVATVLGDGSFYYGLASPENLSWPRQAYEQKRPLLLERDTPSPSSGPTPRDMGLSSYIGVPVLSAGKSVAVMEAIDVNETGELGFYSGRMEESAASLAPRLDEGNSESAEMPTTTGNSNAELAAETIVDLVLRQPYDQDETFEVSPVEWTVLANVNGERSIKSISETTSLPMSQVITLSAALIDRGLVRIGKENRRRL